jgi:hypothetical protein
MVEDVLHVLGRLRESSEEQHLKALLSRVTAWQEFMERGRPPILGADEELGLIGELVVIEGLLNAGLSCTNCVPRTTR